MAGKPDNSRQGAKKIGNNRTAKTAKHAKNIETNIELLERRVKAQAVLLSAEKYNKYLIY